MEKIGAETVKSDFGDIFPLSNEKIDKINLIHTYKGDFNGKEED